MGWPLPYEAKQMALKVFDFIFLCSKAVGFGGLPRPELEGYPSLTSDAAATALAHPDTQCGLYTLFPWESSAFNSLPPTLSNHIDSR